MMKMSKEKKDYFKFFSSVQKTLEDTVKEMLGGIVEDVDLSGMKTDANFSQTVFFQLDGEAEISFNLDGFEIYFIRNFYSFKKMDKVIKILKENGYEPSYD